MRQGVKTSMESETFFTDQGLGPHPGHVGGGSHTAWGTGVGHGGTHSVEHGCGTRGSRTAWDTGAHTDHASVKFSKLVKWCELHELHGAWSMHGMHGVYQIILYL